MLLFYLMFAGSLLVVLLWLGLVSFYIGLFVYDKYREYMRIRNSMIVEGTTVPAGTEIELLSLDDSRVAPGTQIDKDKVIVQFGHTRWPTILDKSDIML